MPEQNRKRLTRIVTRTGDNGTTAMASGPRLAKNHPRVEALGEVDELNSLLGLLLCEVLPGEIRGEIQEIQQDLFDLGAEISLPNSGYLNETALARLESQATEWNSLLPPLDEFLLPGGCRAAALCHVARAVCRRAERRIVALGTEAPALPLRYLNRLSDLLFIAARRINQAEGAAEPLWRGQSKQPS